MTPRTGAGGAAVLLAALFPAACLQTVVLPVPGQNSGAGGGAGLADGGGWGGNSDGGDAPVVMCPNGPGSSLHLSHDDPTIMFIVDHSSSMMSTRLPPNNASRLSVVQGGIKDLLGRWASRTNAGYMVNFGYVEFPQVPRSGSCPSSGCCVGIVYVNTGAMSIQMAMDHCANSSGQNCLPQMDATTTTTVEALATVRMKFNDLALRDPQKFIVLLTDHVPAMCNPPPADACEDAASQIASLDRNLGIPTYLVALGDITDNNDIQCLNLMANSSKARRQGSSAYYSATNETQVKQAMTNPVLWSLCYAQVDDSSFDQSRLLVDIDGTPIARDQTRTNGWDLDQLSNGHTGIFFFGAACESTFLNSQFQRVHATVCGR